MTRKTTRLYYGREPETGVCLYWTMKVRNATKPVLLNGTVEHAMAGERGVSIGCHLSNTAKACKAAFPHPALYVSFTKSVVLVITKITKGQPAECVRYRHGYSKYVDLNDKEVSRATVKAHPELFNRRFTLGAYKEQEAHWRPEYGRKETGQRRDQQMVKGEIGRRRNAGLVFPVLT